MPGTDIAYGARRSLCDVRCGGRERGHPLICSYAMLLRYAPTQPRSASALRSYALPYAPTPYDPTPFPMILRT
eukprot:1302902-Rhodomonas_salina.1